MARANRAFTCRSNVVLRVANNKRASKITLCWVWAVALSSTVVVCRVKCTGAHCQDFECSLESNHFDAYIVHIMVHGPLRQKNEVITHWLSSSWLLPRALTCHYKK